MPQPSYQDGATSLAALTARCLNLSKDFVCFGLTPKVETVQKKFTNQSGEPIGSDTRKGHTEGELSIQLDDTSDAIPEPGYIWLFRSVYYIGGAITPPFNSHEVVKIGVGALKAVNPIISTLLSSLGQKLAVTVDSAAGAYALTCAAVNTRAGATLTWSLVDAPSGMTINASTGAIAWATPLDGTYEITVKVSDAVSGEKNQVGVGFLKLTVT